MASKLGYFIDIVKGKVETAEEHDTRIRVEERAKVLKEFVDYAKAHDFRYGEMCISQAVVGFAEFIAKQIELKAKTNETD